MNAVVFPGNMLQEIAAGLVMEKCMNQIEEITKNPKAAGVLDENGELDEEAFMDRVLLPLVSDDYDSFSDSFGKHVKPSIQ